MSKVINFKIPPPFFSSAKMQSLKTVRNMPSVGKTGIWLSWPKTPSCVSVLLPNSQQVISVHLFLSGLSPLFGHPFARTLFWMNLGTGAPTASYKITQTQNTNTKPSYHHGCFQFLLAISSTKSKEAKGKTPSSPPGFGSDEIQN